MQRLPDFRVRVVSAHDLEEMFTFPLLSSFLGLPYRRVTGGVVERLIERVVDIDVEAILYCLAD
jgi:hypothetical protein